MQEDGFDDDCIGDEKDQEYLNTLSNVEREKILADRFEKREEALRKRDLLKHSKERDAYMAKKYDEIDRMKEARQRKKDKKDFGEEDFANYDNLDDNFSDDSDDSGQREIN